MSSIEHDDDYSNMDIFEVMEKGNKSTLKNNMSKDQVAKIEKMLLEQFDEKFEEINKLIEEIRELAISVEPSGLLNYCSSVFKMTCINIFPSTNYQLIICRVLGWPNMYRVF